MDLHPVGRGGRIESAGRSFGLRGSRRVGHVALIAAISAFFPIPTAISDVFHLRDGGTVDGQVIDQSADAYRVKTIFGTVTVAADSIERIERRPSVFERYDERARKVADTPADHAELAEWCEQNGLRTERRKHFERAIEIDTNYEPARVALGYEKVDGGWQLVSTRQVAPVARQKSAGGGAAAENAVAPEAASDAPPDDEAGIRAAQGRWSKQIRSIRATYFDPGKPSMAEEGRRRLLEIRDPFAILPMTRALGEADKAARAALVAALAAFQEDEATLNLNVIALVERDDEIRAAAVAALAKRKDPRVGAQLRKALRSDSDVVVRHAAEAIRAMKLTTAVPELIDQLTVDRRKRVEVPIRRYFGSIADDYSRQGFGGLAGGRVRYKPTVGVATAGVSLGGVESAQQVRDVTVFRTEVLEALKAITGQNFGFEEAAWRLWYQEQKK